MLDKCQEEKTKPVTIGDGFNLKNEQVNFQRIYFFFILILHK